MQLRDLGFLGPPPRAGQCGRVGAPCWLAGHQPRCLRRSVLPRAAELPAGTRGLACAVAGEECCFLFALAKLGLVCLALYAPLPVPSRRIVHCVTVVRKGRDSLGVGVVHFCASDRSMAHRASGCYLLSATIEVLCGQAPFCRVFILWHPVRLPNGPRKNLLPGNQTNKRVGTLVARRGASKLSGSISGLRLACEQRHFLQH